jgi:catechol 2,3-dioxygenase-like lactoylglutathione lyase family enzyme
VNFRPHHVALTVNNTTESIGWYQSKLGFKVIHKYNKHGMEITQLKLENVRLELFCYGKDTKPRPNYRKALMDDLHVMGTKHLCIEVDDIDEMIKKLRAKDVEFATKIDTAGFGGRYIFIKDCNGILIEFYQE